MLKIRLQGTIQDMEWFWHFLEHQKEVEVLRRSEAYTNKGTNKYYRMYADVERIGGYDGSKEAENLRRNGIQIFINPTDFITGKMAGQSGIFDRGLYQCNLQRGHDHNHAVSQ